jgi:GNAT superfamily N-acetyltransferase
MDEERTAQFMRILEEAFPPTERRVSSGQYELLHHPRYVIHAAEQDGRMIAFMAVWNLSGVTFLEHFAVDASHRNGGIGGEMLERMRAESTRLVLEAELPADDLTRRRIAFYRRHGMCLNGREYAQMPLRAGDAPTPMVLMSSPDGLNDEEFVRVRREIYRHVYGLTEI